MDNLKKNIQDLELTIKRQESEKQGKDQGMRTLQVRSRNLFSFVKF